MGGVSHLGHIFSVLVEIIEGIFFALVSRFFGKRLFLAVFCNGGTFYVSFL